MRLAIAAAAALLTALAAAPAMAQTPGSAAADPEALRVPSVSDRPPPGRMRSAREMLLKAQSLAAVREARTGRGRTYGRAFLKGEDRWQVAFLEADPGGEDDEIAQVILDDRTGAVLETWTGIQVEWTMARGYPGAFGRTASALYVWLALLAVFVLPFLRPPWRMLHVDLAVIASLSVSYAAFNAGAIGWSVPLAYPPLLYLLARALWLAAGRPRRRGGGELRLLVNRDVLLFGLVFLLGFRLGLNLAASNVIDVGYAGVIGADRLAHGEELYGNFPRDNPRGDTYGPLNYLLYLPFEALWPWRGDWDELPAAHGAALAFDLGAAGLVALLGRRLRTPGGGLLLAYLWLACPWTLLVLASNANDALVAVLVLATLLVAGRPLARGALLGAAALTKFAPLVLLPLVLAHPATGHSRRQAARRTTAGVGLVAAALLLPVALLEGGLGDFADRTLGFQLGRESPFSIWGLWDLGPLQLAAQAAAGALALAVAVWPRERDGATLAALAAAVLIAAQLGVEHWFYLYVVWFLGPFLVAALADAAGGGPASPTSPGAEPARSPRPAAAAGRG